jgi:autoinducer 2-degrading protein
VYVIAITVHVKPEHIEAFKAATLENARNTRKEPGNARFDVLQSDEDPTRFMLYEAYHNKDGITAHRQTEHYNRWQQAAADWMAKPRERATHNSLFFGDGQG